MTSAFTFIERSGYTFWFRSQYNKVWQVAMLFQRGIIPKKRINVNISGKELIVGLYNPNNYAFKRSEKYHLCFDRDGMISLCFPIGNYVASWYRIPRRSIPIEIWRELFGKQCNQPPPYTSKGDEYKIVEKNVYIYQDPKVTEAIPEDDSDYEPNEEY